MKAVVKTALGKGNIEVRDVEQPRPGPGQVMIKVSFCGICGSDIHVWHDAIKIPLQPPVVMGHEFSGVVAEAGEGVTSVKVGQRVTSQTSASVCGVCHLCRAGFDQLCPERRVTGYWFGGAFTNYVVVPERGVHPLPDWLSMEEAALFEPFACTVHGVQELTGVAAGDVVVVSGPGAIGLLAMQVAKAEGAKIILLGTNKDIHRLEVGKKLGADITVNVQEQNPLDVVLRETDGDGADVAIDCSGAPRAVEMNIDLLRKRGKYTQIGLFGRPFELDFEKICYKELKVTGSLSQKWTSWRRGFRLVGQGKVQLKPLISDILPITAWEEGFRKHEETTGLKTLLTPVD